MKSFIRFIIRFGDALFLGFVVFSVTPILLIRTEFNLPFFWAFKNLSFPILVVCLGIGLTYRRDFLEASKSRLKYWFCLLFCPPILILMSGGLVVLYNATVEPQETVIIEGSVLGKRFTGGKYPSCVLIIETDDKSLELVVSREEYDRFSAGDNYRDTKRKGSLGFVYEWKFSGKG